MILREDIEKHGVEKSTGLPKIICLTPVKNEAWILEKFLMAASTWADHIIIADQLSDDGSREIARKFPKVILIENVSVEFNEPERQRLLIEKAREFEGPRLLIALDADEFLTANFQSSEEWYRILHAAPGTVFRFKWVNLKPDFKKYWSPHYYLPWGFMDDGSDHVGEMIHSTRIPMPADSPTIDMQDVGVLHYQYTDWQRMESKHRWYQCWEVLNRPYRGGAKIYYHYHHMYQVNESDLKDVKEEWFDYYLRNGIDMKVIDKQGIYWWDREVLNYFRQYGMKKFRKLDIWDTDWKTLADHFGISINGIDCDPRRAVDKLIHRLLKSVRSGSNLVFKLLCGALWVFGW